MEKLKRVLGGSDEPEDETGIMTQINDATTLSWSTRIKGFVICFVIGVALSLLSSVVLFLNPLNLTGFALLYTFGNVTALSSTFFLMGPIKQAKRMFAETRWIATLVMLGCLVMTLLCAILWKKAPLVFLFIILQFLAMTWYSLSYIPFARDAVKKCCTNCLPV